MNQEIEADDNPFLRMYAIAGFSSQLLLRCRDQEIKGYALAPVVGDLPIPVLTLDNQIKCLPPLCTWDADSIVLADDTVWTMRTGKRFTPEFEAAKKQLKSICPDLEQMVKILLGLYQPTLDCYDTGFDRCCMRVDPGWLSLIALLMNKIRTVTDSIEITDIKEKWGELRIYAVANEQAHKLIDQATAASVYICDCCGLAGELYTDGWWRTRCPECESRRTIQWT